MTNQVFTASSKSNVFLALGIYLDTVVQIPLMSLQRQYCVEFGSLEFVM